jgi:hypothetical protein
MGVMIGLLQTLFGMCCYDAPRYARTKFQDTYGLLPLQYLIYFWSPSSSIPNILLVSLLFNTQHTFGLPPLQYLI